jgi:adenylylsulfate kinase
MSAENIHPEFHRQLGRERKEALLKQRGLVVWLYGLSGSGKSTLAHALEAALHERGHATMLLDGDNLRTGLNSGLGFTEDDRRENIRRAAEVAKIGAQNGLVTICCFITPYQSLRHLAKQIVGEKDFLESYVHARFESCAARDPKGLYKKAAEGQVAHFTGRDSVFEEPESPTLRLDTEVHSRDECLKILLSVVEKHTSLTQG